MKKLVITIILIATSLALTACERPNNEYTSTGERIYIVQSVGKGGIVVTDSGIVIARRIRFVEAD